MMYQIVNVAHTLSEASGGTEKPPDIIKAERLYKQAEIGGPGERKA